MTDAIAAMKTHIHSAAIARCHDELPLTFVIEIIKITGKMETNNASLLVFFILYCTVPYVCAILHATTLLQNHFRST